MKTVCAFLAPFVLLLALALPASAAVVVSATPPAGTVTELTQITVQFSEPVIGVNATDFLVNGQFASAVFGSGASYTFTFLQPAYGLAQISWDVGHGIADLAPPGNPFNATGPGATWQYTLVDLTPPTVLSVSPGPGRTVASLASIEVLFTEPVSGVNAGDLLINSIPASSVAVVTPSQYLFQFPQPNTGVVQVAWLAGHGIQDLAAAPNAFGGGGWNYVLDTNPAATQVIISEFMAQNDNAILDEDGDDSDWIELYNAGVATVYLGNWFLTDNANRLDKWQFPNTNLPPNGYLLVWASEKDRRVAGAPLHTNFKLDGGGEYLGLVRSNAVGTLEVMWDFGKKYPDQEPNLSSGLAMNVGPYSTLIPTGATVKLLVPTGDLGVGWTAPGFIDTGWSTVVTGIGFDTGTNYDPGIATDIQAQMLNVNPSVFIRIPFTVPDPSVIQDLRLRLRYDDGWVAYLNGVEAARANAPASPQWNSAAPAGHGSDTGGGAPTSQDFDTPGTAYATRQFSGSFAPLVTTEGGAGANFLRLANTSASVLNTIAFNRTAVGAFSAVTISFEFRVTPGSGQADGFGVALMSTSLHGTTGAPDALSSLYEEANLAGALGFGFDVYNNGAAGNDPNNNHVSLHYNGAIRTLTQATPNMDLSNGQWHRANITVNFTGGDARVTVRVTPNVRGVPGATETLYNDFVITGVPAYESRLCISARTGGENANHDFDNISVQYGPASGMVPVEEFNLSSALNTLVPGPNVLAIHGLNRATSDGDFLIIPELVGRSVAVLTNTQNYFAQPTPGSANEGGAAGLAGDVIFSIPGGVYTNKPSISVALSALTPNATIRYTIDGTTPTAASPLYSTPLIIANSTVVKARAFAAGMLPGRIIVHTYTMLETDVFTFSSNLPLVIIDTFGQGIVADNKTPASMVFIDTFRGRASLRDTPDAKVRAGIELRGSSSLGFPKNNMGFETRDENTNDFKVSLLGMPAESDWVLYGPYTDKTLMNDYLAYELWEAMGHYSVRRRYVEVFRDTTGGRLTFGDYWGIYVLLEKIKIDNDRVDIPELNGGDNTPPNVTGGYIFKRDRFDGNEYTFNVPGGTGFGGSTLGVEDPKGAQITTAQKNYLVSWFAQVSASLSSANWTNPVTGYAAYVDADSFIDHYWMVEMPKQIDGYRLSNFYHKDRNGKLKEGPIWDWNLSFGNANYLEGGLTNNYYAPAVGDADYLYYRRLFADPDFYQKHIDRWFSLRTNVFATSNLMARIDAITNLLNEAQVRDFVKWPRLGSYVWPNPDGPNLSTADGITSIWDVNFTTVNTYSGIIGEMKKWLNGRLIWIDNQFPAKPPAFSLPGGLVPSGTVLGISAPAGTTYYTLNGTDPRGAGGNPAPGVLTYSGPITITTNVGVFARARVGTAANSWSGPTVAPYVIETPKLIITEIMFHPDAPPPGSTNVDEDFEYIEVKNNGATPINLLRSRISGGVDVELPNYVLNPGCYVVVVANTNAFRSRYGNVPVIVGSYTDRLANGGERLVFEGPVREPIHDFTYQDGWQEIADGFGFSLVPVNENGPLSGWGLPGSWRGSSALHGSPGTNDSAVPNIPNVVINEALTHAPLPQNNAVELHNFSNFPADISYWYLTDEFDVPQKYQFPSNTLIAVNGYLVIYQSTFNTGPHAFSLNPQGGALWLFSADSAGNLTGHFSGFDFGPQFSGITFGYHLTSQGDDHFVAQTSPTLGGPNSGPRVGPVVITEINYHPRDVMNVYGVWDNQEDEYIELRNITGSSVALYHPTNNAIVWKLRDAVDYSFAPGTILPASAYALIVSFDPANTTLLNAFKANNDVPNGIAIFGPYSGKLDNSSDSVELVRPDDPVAGEIPYVLADKVRYSDVTPWPPEADGFGPSLQRVNESAYGNDPANWAVGKSAGTSYVPGNPPEITQQPQNVSVLGTLTANFSVTALGTPPLSYQWFFNNTTAIVNATNSMLSIPNVSASQAGLYRCLVLSPSGVKFSSNATLTVVAPASITLQPANVFLRVPPDPAAPVNRGATFRVAASTANPPLSYQWRVNGTNIPPGAPDILGINTSTLIVTNVVFSQAGVYSCAVSDANGAIYSAGAILGVFPFMLAGSQPMTVAEGADISVSAVVQAYPPPFLYSWRRGTPINTNIVSASNTNFATWNSTAAGYILTSGITSSNYQLRLIFTNLTTGPNGLALINNNSFITVVADTDHDGIPNTVEAMLGLDQLLAADGAGDLDGDGMTNSDEYRAGTDPANPASYLRVDLSTVPGQATVRFGAVSNKTYTVQFANQLPAPFWTGLADVPALTSNRVEVFVDPTWSANRIYRVVTPRQQ